MEMEISSNPPISGFGPSNEEETALRFKEKHGAAIGSEEEGSAGAGNILGTAVWSRDTLQKREHKRKMGSMNLGEMSRALVVVEEGPRASPIESINMSPPPPVRFPPYPKNGTARDVIKWSMKCRRLRKKALKDPRLNLPTMRKSSDPDTAAAVQCPKQKETVLVSARNVVSISSTVECGIQQCSGIIFPEHKGKSIVVTSSFVVTNMGKLAVPLPMISIRLPDNTVLQGKLALFNEHHRIVLLEVDMPYPLEVAARPNLRSPAYGEEVYALSRGRESNLMVRKGKISFLEESNCIGRDFYMFLSCDIPEEGTGGCIADLEGTAIGMSFNLSPNPAVLSITTISICIDMWLQFGQIARPLHGLSLRSVAFLDLSLQEELSICYDINSGFIVGKVRCGSAADQLGIEYGDVIMFDEEQFSASSLPQLEDYFLNLGWRFLQHPKSSFQLNLKVCSLLRRSGRRISLPITFCS